MFLYVNFKAIFCVTLVAALTNIVLTQNLYTSMFDDTRGAFMSFSSGSSPTSRQKPRPWPPVASRRRRTRSPAGFSGNFFYLNLIDFQLLLNNAHTCAGLRRHPERKINCFSRVMPKIV